MTLRARIVSYGATALLVIAGVVCAAALHSGTGQFVGFVLIGVGLVIATGLAFLEVGLSEDRERARERDRGRDGERDGERDAALGKPPKRPGRVKPARLERSRGHRRRLG
jgi:hypothetical protein